MQIQMNGPQQPAPPPAPRISASAKILAAMVLWLAIVGVGVYFYLSKEHPSDPAAALARSEENEFRPGSLGSGRRAILEDATRRYVELHPDAPLAVREGKALAPAEFLNDQLLKDGEKWRVRSVHGMIADMYEIT